MLQRNNHLHRHARPDSRHHAFPSLLAAALVIVWAGQDSHAGVVFDGTIGPNALGTERTGIFEISQQDGELAGNNLFHSFSSFGVSQGELATFTHQSESIEHIVARVTGLSPSGIHGGLQVRRAASGVLSPTNTALWLMNPNGIVIGEGASFDPQSTFVLSTANRLGFANGDNFYSHEPEVSSVLSIADPTSFGFLDHQALPANVTPRGITVAINDAANTDAPLFLSNMTLVGTSVDPLVAGIHITGDLAQAFDPAAIFAPSDSSQLQALSLGLAALNTGGSVNMERSTLAALTAAPDAALGSILIENSNLLVSDSDIAPSSSLSVLAEHLIIDNSYLETLAASQPVAVSIRATGSVLLLESILRTTTFTEFDAGDIRIDTPDYRQFGGLVSSRNLGLGAPTGDPGNLLFGTSASLPMESFLLQQGIIQSSSMQLSQAGDVVLNVQGALTLEGSADGRASLASIGRGAGGSGNVILVADRILTAHSDIFSSGVNPEEQPFIALQAGTGGIEMVNTSLEGQVTAERAGASIFLSSAGDISLRSDQGTSRISTGTGGDLKGGDIFISAEGDLQVRGSFDISSDSVGDSSSLGNAGSIALSGRRVELTQDGNDDTATSISSLTTSTGAGGAILISAVEDLVIRGRHSLSSTTAGPGDSGAVILRAASISIESPLPTTLSTSSVSTGDAGIISLDAEDTLLLAGVNINSAATDEGAAGFLLLSADTITIEESLLFTTTRANDAEDIPAQILLTAGDIMQVSDSTLQSNSAGLSPAGQIGLSAGKLLLVDNASIQTGTIGDGITGSISLLSEGDIVLRGENTELLSNSLGASAAGDVSVVAADTLLFEGGGFIQTSAEGAGDAGTLLLAADTVRLRNAVVEGTSENAGGGDVNIFGRDIQLGGDQQAGSFVRIAASSQSSDATGSGGSITLGNSLAPAELVLVRNSILTASANAGNGGLININADQFLRDALSIFLVTSTLGEPGSLEINAPEQDISSAISELDVDILDASNLIQDRCAVPPEDASSLVVVGRGAIGETYGGYLTSGFQPSHGNQVNLEALPDGAGAGANAGQPQVAWRMAGECRQVR